MANFLQGNLGRMSAFTQGVANAADIRGRSRDRLNTSLRNLGGVFGRLRGERLARDEAGLDREFQTGRDEAQRQFRKDVEMPHELFMAEKENEYNRGLIELRAQLEKDRTDEGLPVPPVELFPQILALTAGRFPDAQFDGVNFGWEWTPENIDRFREAFTKSLVDLNISSEGRIALLQMLEEYFPEAPQVVAEPDAVSGAGYDVEGQRDVGETVGTGFGPVDRLLGRGGEDVLLSPPQGSDVRFFQERSTWDKLRMVVNRPDVPQEYKNTARAVMDNLEEEGVYETRDERKSWRDWADRILRGERPLAGPQRAF